MLVKHSHAASGIRIISGVELATKITKITKKKNLYGSTPKNSTFFSVSSCLRVFVALDVADYPDAAESTTVLRFPRCV
jgi:hypothetical protein